MKHIIEFFDRSYIINLLDRIDRRAQTEREFSKIGFRIPNQNIVFYEAKRPSEKGNFPDVGTRGNFESHRNVLDLALKERLRNVLIFEDDVSFRSIDEDVERRIVSRLQVEDWDVIYFGYCKPSDYGLSGPLMPWSNDVIGAHCYAVNERFISPMFQFMNECAKRPCGHPHGGPMTADGAYNHFHRIIPNLRTFLAVPNLAHQRSSRTDVHPTPIFDRIAWLQPAVRGTRAIKHRLRMAIDGGRLRSSAFVGHMHGYYENQSNFKRIGRK
jgi:hypothetical protein